MYAGPEVAEGPKIWRLAQFIISTRFFDGLGFALDLAKMGLGWRANTTPCPLLPPALREIRFGSQQRLQSKLNQKSISQHNAYNFDFFFTNLQE